MIRIDHVLRTVKDLDRAAEALLRDHGLASAPGGRHPGWGTGNRIVPLGDQYLELLGVVDASEAETSWFGQWVIGSAADGDRWAAWAVRTDDLDAWARASGLEVSEGSREQLDGSVLRWRMAGVDEALAEPPLPFLIQWVTPDFERPGRQPAPHRLRPNGIARLDLAGDEARFREWLGDESTSLPFAFVEGPPGVRNVAVGTPDRELTLSDETA
jgi:hypothetical protein